MADAIDSHCHVAQNWYEPVETLLHHMDRSGVAKAALVQHLATHDNSYLLQAVARHPDRFSAVVAVTLNADDATRQVVSLKEAGACGIRLRPTSRSAGADPYAVWRAAAALHMPISCVGSASTFAAREFALLLEAVPGLTVVLEHLGGTSTADTTEEMVQARAEVLRLARYPGVRMKIPGLAEFTPRLLSLDASSAPFDIRAASAVLAKVIGAFTVRRLMWGSDFPVVSSREGYRNALEWPRQIVEELCGRAGEAIFTTTGRILL